MKAQILKIAGVKSEKEFYKKYPSEAAFMKKHGKEFKKAQTSDAIEKAQFGTNSWANSGNQHYNPNLAGMSGQPSSGGLAGNVMMSNQQTANQPITSGGSVNTSKGKGTPLNVGGLMNVFNAGMDAVENRKAAIKRGDTLQTWAGVTNVIKDAEISNAFLEQEPVELNRVDNLRNIRNANELYMPKGRGTDVYGQNGSMIGGNPTEVQNTYGIGSSVYKDLEDPEEIKAYQTGGGFGNFMNQLNGSLGGDATGGFMGNIGNQGPFTSMIAGDSTLGGLGGALGSIGGPGGAMLGAMVGRFFDDEPGRQRNAQNQIASNQSAITRLKSSKNINNRLSSIGVGQNGEDLIDYEEGGYMNPEYNPQLITMFGDHNADDFADYAHKFRAGGHLKEYTAPSERAMETYENGGEISSYALGGKLKSYWGGEVEDESYNPYLPGSGKTAMIKGASHKNGGVGISYGEAQNGYNGDEADIEAEFNEPVMEMEEGGSIDPNTGEPNTSAVVFGNIPFTKKVVAITEDPDLMRLADKYDGMSMKKMISKLNKEEILATSKQAKGLKLMDGVDANNKWGKLDAQTAQTIVDATDMKLQQIAKDKMKSADFQNALQDIKQKISYERGKNISAEALGKGQIKDDLDPITKDAPLESPYVGKSGANLRRAQGGADITEEEYNQFLKEYEESKATGKKRNPANLKFQRHYNKTFPKEALAAIQKTTAEKGLSNKAKQMGLTKEDIASGKDLDRILQSNEDEFYGPITEQYNASVKSKFKKTPPVPVKDIQLNELGGPPSTTTVNTSKPPIDVVPLRNNYVGDAVNVFGRLFGNNDNIPPIDPRQFAGEYIASAKNTPVPVNIERMHSQLAPVYRITNQDIRNQSTGSFRDAMRMNQFNPEAAASIFGRKAMADQTSYGDEFRTNQGIEQQIFGGNRALVNQDMATNLALDRERDKLQSIADSKTKEIDQKIGSSFADKNMKYDADVMKYKIQRNMFPQFAYDQSGRIRTQNAYYKPVMPQIYGGKSTIEEVPVYDANGKIIRYKMIDSSTKDTIERPSTATPPFIPGQGYVGKNGKSILKNARNSSVVKAYKNL
jgi:hypothetical protein